MAEARQDDYEDAGPGGSEHIDLRGLAMPLRMAAGNYVVVLVLGE